MEEEKKRRSAGFTLIELMVVIVILGLLIGVIGFRLMGRTEEARRTAAKLQMRSLVNALQLYKLDSGGYPTTEQGLEALVRPPARGTAPRNYPPGGYLEGGQVPRDPWGNPYVYMAPGAQGREFEIRSLGADGKEGGEGENADIGSWDLR